ncbi:MAG: hypothetical protein HRU35_03245 [Rickettsiaceae bacterium]|nr:hypothetical protein [Rickettsiaceae bacterium]
MNNSKAIILFSCSNKHYMDNKDKLKSFCQDNNFEIIKVMNLNDYDYNYFLNYINEVNQQYPKINLIIEEGIYYKFDQIVTACLLAALSLREVVQICEYSKKSKKTRLKILRQERSHRLMLIATENYKMLLDFKQTTELDN